MVSKDITFKVGDRVRVDGRAGIIAYIAVSGAMSVRFPEGLRWVARPALTRIDSMPEPLFSLEEITECSV